MDLKLGSCIPYCVGVPFNPFPNKPLFLCVCCKCLLKTPWEKEKLLDTSNFAFSHRVFHPFRELFPSFLKLKNFRLQTLQFGSLKFVIWERVKSLIQVNQRHLCLHSFVYLSFILVPSCVPSLICVSSIHSCTILYALIHSCTFMYYLSIRNYPV